MWEATTPVQEAILHQVITAVENHPLRNGLEASPLTPTVNAIPLSYTWDQAGQTGTSMPLPCVPSSLHCSAPLGLHTSPQLSATTAHLSQNPAPSSLSGKA